jgi:hypothetical protein
LADKKESGLEFRTAEFWAHDSYAIDLPANTFNAEEWRTAVFDDALENAPTKAHADKLIKDNAFWNTENKMTDDPVNHPAHYGGKDNPYEVIKVIEAWGLDNDFFLATVIKYIPRAGKKGNALEDLQKARWYLDRKISNMEKRNAANN